LGDVRGGNTGPVNRLKGSGVGFSQALRGISLKKRKRKQGRQERKPRAAGQVFPEDEGGSVTPLTKEKKDRAPLAHRREVGPESLEFNCRGTGGKGNGRVTKNRGCISANKALAAEAGERRKLSSICWRIKSISIGPSDSKWGKKLSRNSCCGLLSKQCPGAQLYNGLKITSSERRLRANG